MYFDAWDIKSFLDGKKKNYCKRGEGQGMSLWMRNAAKFYAK